VEDVVSPYDAFGLRVEPQLRSPESGPRGAELETLVREAINQLSPMYRLVILLRDIEELDTAETAAMLNVSTGAVKTRLHRARAALKTLLAPVLSQPADSPDRGVGRRLRGFFNRTLPTALTCGEFEALIASYLDGELDDRPRAAFEIHLRRCADCQRYLAGYRRSVALGQTLCETPELPIPRDVPPDLADAALSARQMHDATHTSAEPQPFERLPQ
jgi:hypothetical protein